MYPQIVVFTDNPTTLFQTNLLKRFHELGFAPMVDSKHTTKEWFVENFMTLDHKVFYNQPFLLQGTIDQVDFDLSGIPHFVIYYTKNEESKLLTVEDWECIIRYFDWKLNEHGDGSDYQLRHAESLLLPPTSTPLEQGPESIPEDTDIVKVKDMKKYYYKFESKHLSELDLMMYEITKPFVDRPFTILIDKFSENGPKQLFSDLFISEDWGKDSMDIRFLDSLWTYLKLDGTFNVDQILKERTESCYPNESGEIRCEPKVYRISMESMIEKGEMNGKKF